MWSKPMGPLVFKAPSNVPHTGLFDGMLKITPTSMIPCPPWDESLILHSSQIADASGCSQSYAKTLLWNRSTDCCSWDGVYCDEMTEHVIELDLSCSQLQGKFHSNNRFFRLSNLKRLDLSFNDFSGSRISPKFGGFSNLIYLDLCGSSFTGQIPSEIS
ncbi:hypothetical protein CQW23_04224 [Capsicum baccatum]|uniref:Leucine-rich repeat-containing N-terminal plant-type domain-containing protein n=1 Tax=Capsicum baccatum TaxID=33114 RepID=A0A2G2XE19_CAPBA|nr:hypothetical protein CQW23_04224 [Capsicum baccatum]